MPKQPAKNLLRTPSRSLYWLARKRTTAWATVSRTVLTTPAPARRAPVGRAGWRDTNRSSVVLSVDLGLGDGRTGLQEVEVAPLVGLGDVRQVQGAVAAAVLGRWWLPIRAALGQLVVVDLERQPPGGHVEFDHVPVAHQGQRAADGGLGG